MKPITDRFGAILFGIFVIIVGVISPNYCKQAIREAFKVEK